MPSAIKSTASTSLTRLSLGAIHVDKLTTDSALSFISTRINTGKGGYILTPNIDHIVQAESNPRLKEAYQGAFLSLADGKPLIWLSKLLGHALPEKISGSDFTLPLLIYAANQKWPVFFVGAAEGVAETAVKNWKKKAPELIVAGITSPPMGFETTKQNDALIEAINLSGAKLVLLALGCPKQELWAATYSPKLPGAILIGIGATFDFAAGKIKRAPKWISNSGLEWFYRFIHEPRWLGYRYFIRGLRFFPIAFYQYRRGAEIKEINITSL